MSKYIKQDKAIKIVKSHYRVDNNLLEVIAYQISNLPPEDVQPVVQCKDCKHRDPEDKKCDCGHDILWQLPRRDNWYCADAERRTDAES